MSDGESVGAGQQIGEVVLPAFTGPGSPFPRAPLPPVGIQRYGSTSSCSTGLRSGRRTVPLMLEPFSITVVKPVSDCPSASSSGVASSWYCWLSHHSVMNGTVEPLKAEYDNR